MRQVHVDPEAGRSALINSQGGTIAVTAPGGAAVTLTIPPGAISGAEQIGVFPIVSLGTLPTAAKLLAGVQFSPDGLTFAVPATLTISLPSAPEAGTGAVGWHGDGDRVDLVPFAIEGTTATLPIFHFSGTGLVVPPGVIAFVSQCAQDDYSCLSEWFQGKLARALSPLHAQEVRNVLLNWYLDAVRPTEDADLAKLSDMLLDAHPIGDEADGILGGMNWHYAAWRSSLSSARDRIGDPTFLATELADADRTAATILGVTYNVLNRACVDVAATDPETALRFANDAVGVHWGAASWGLDTVANHLDLESLLDNDCVQVVIDPGRTYTGTAPDSDGAVKVSVGYRIAGGDLQTPAGLLQVSSEITGSQHLFVALADEAGNYSQDMHWPAGMDPIRIDIRAEILIRQGAHANPSNLARFDRITKSTTSRIAVTSDVPGAQHIEVIDSDGTNVRSITSGPNDTGPSWSPDGSRLVFSRHGSGIWTMKADGTDLKQITSGASDSDPIWAPDRTRIAFQRSGGNTSGRLNLALMNADGSGQTLTSVLLFGGISWSPDSRQIAYAANDDVATTIQVLGKPIFINPFRIFLYDVASGASTKLITHDCEPWGAANPAWSPDGTRIAILCGTSGPHPTRIATIDPSGGAFNVIWTAPNDSGYGATWSPDATQLAISGLPAGLLIVDAGGSTAPGGTIAGGERIASAAWAP